MKNIFLLLIICSVSLFAGVDDYRPHNQQNNMDNCARLVAALRMGEHDPIVDVCRRHIQPNCSDAEFVTLNALLSRMFDPFLAPNLLQDLNLQLQASVNPQCYQSVMTVNAVRLQPNYGGL